MMSVIVNGERRAVEMGATVADLVRQLEGDPRRPGVAVAVNGEVVRRRDWADRRVDEDDRVEVLTAQQGG